MAIKVIFGKNGFYHPSYGRLGRGAGKGTVYELPDTFAEVETVTVDVMDHSARPPRKVGEQEITRKKYLPSSAKVLDADDWEDMVEEAADNNEPAPRPVRPKPAQGEEDKIPGKGKTAKAQSAVERTTGQKPARRKAAAS